MSLAYCYHYSPAAFLCCLTGSIFTYPISVFNIFTSHFVTYKLQFELQCS